MHFPWFQCSCGCRWALIKDTTACRIDQTYGNTKVGYTTVTASSEQPITAADRATVVCDRYWSRLWLLNQTGPSADPDYACFHYCQRTKCRQTFHIRATHLQVLKVHFHSRAESRTVPLLLTSPEAESSKLTG